MTKYELKYFNVRGRGEIIRITLAAADQKFKDTRYEFQDWPSHKQDTPGKALPVLIVDDKTVLTQSIAIARYLSKKHNLYGKDDCECYKIDEIIDCFLDIFNALVKIKFAPENMKEDLKVKYKETYVRIFDYLEGNLKTGQTHFVGQRLTLADISSFAFLEFCITLDANVLKTYPKIDAIRETVSKVPSIAEYLEKRPKTDF
ncbi:glutathione S-transferase isoform X1 [Octopus vulgaris]|uniref:glutathione transferase n=1 Tax=Octopus vulgaris TaxID=6645 RepID=A0AA36AVB6_OCTVU|nr:glutathione S-transferase isoform X1 [Octopus vulgaris]